MDRRYKYLRLHDPTEEARVASWSTISGLSNYEDDHGASHLSAGGAGIARSERRLDFF